MPRHRSRRSSDIRLSSYELSLRDFTLGTGVIWILVSLLYCVLSIVPTFQVFGLVVSLAIMLASASLFLAIKTRQQYYVIPFLTVLILLVIYIVANIVIIVLIVNDYHFDYEYTFNVIMDHFTNIELLRHHVIWVFSLGIVFIIFIFHYIFRGIILYYLALRKHDDEPELHTYSSNRSVHFA